MKIPYCSNESPIFVNPFVLQKIHSKTYLLLYSWKPTFDRCWIRKSCLTSSPISSRRLKRQPSRKKRKTFCDALRSPKGSVIVDIWLPSLLKNDCLGCLFVENGLQLSYCLHKAIMWHSRKELDTKPFRFLISRSVIVFVSVLWE